MTIPDSEGSTNLQEAARGSRGPTKEQQLLSGIAKTVFRLNGELLSIAEDLARPTGLTAAWWQVLATVLREPVSVADISRSIGNSRQSVQRVADLLVDQGLAEYRPNPAHRRAKLLAPTEEGRSAVRAIAPAHADLARRLSSVFGEEELRQVTEHLTRLSAALQAVSEAESHAATHLETTASASHRSQHSRR